MVAVTLEGLDEVACDEVRRSPVASSSQVDFSVPFFVFVLVLKKEVEQHQQVYTEDKDNGIQVFVRQILPDQER